SVPYPESAFPNLTRFNEKIPDPNSSPEELKDYLQKMEAYEVTLFNEINNYLKEDKYYAEWNKNIDNRIENLHTEAKKLHDNVNKAIQENTELNKKVDKNTEDIQRIERYLHAGYMREALKYFNLLLTTLN